MHQSQALLQFRSKLQLHLQTQHQVNDKMEHTNETTNQQISHVEEQAATEPLVEVKPETEHIQTSREQLLFQCSVAAKKVGLTKIRLEDCYRCDACSCIYLEEEDYRKHMRNFHRDPLKKRRAPIHRQRKTCKSCCKHCNCRGDHQHPSKSVSASSNDLHFNIKDRWRKMVSTHIDPTTEGVEIKTEPEMEESEDLLDYSHLLSQVEVRIKTEVDDDAGHTGKEQTVNY